MAQQQITSADTVSRDAFITTMRQVAASVAVVTTDGPAGRYGATVSTFCSVSADPPTVLICLSAERRIAKAVRDNQYFCVNLLSQNHIAIANRFAGMDDARVSDRFSGIDPLWRARRFTGIGCRDCLFLQDRTVSCLGQSSGGDRAGHCGAHR